MLPRPPAPVTPRGRVRYSLPSRLPQTLLAKTTGAAMLVVVEATLSAMCCWQASTSQAVHRNAFAPQMSAGHRVHQIRMSAKRKVKVVASPAVDEEPAADEKVNVAIQNILDEERCNVCLTHVNADFDSLAGNQRRLYTVAPPHGREPPVSFRATWRPCPQGDIAGVM